MASADVAAGDRRSAHLAISRVVRLVSEVRLAVLIIGFASALASRSVGVVGIVTVVVAVPYSLVPARSWERRGDLLSRSGILLACDVVMTVLVVLVLGGELMVVYGAATVALMGVIVGTRMACGVALPIVVALALVEWLPPAWSNALVAVTSAVGIFAMAWAGDSLGAALRAQDAANAELAKLQVRRAGTVERVRIARDLHDTVAGDLAGASMVAATLVERLDREQVSEQGRRLAHDLLEICKQAHADTRVALGELRRADAFAPDDLAETCARWSSRTGIPALVDVDVRLGAVPRELTDELRAVLLELLENVRRHSGAQQVEVRAGLEDGTVKLAVTDDGRGRDANDVVPPGHYGLTGIAERARVWGGELSNERPEAGGLRCVVTFRQRTGEDAR
ncbi:sensor histidine kinase [Cellulomonas sp. URHB0016]